MNLVKSFVLASCVSLVLTPAMAAQRRAPGAAPAGVGVTVALKVGTTAYDFNGQAKCTYAPVASIYTTMAEQWHLEQSDGARSASFTLWRPKNGSGDMFSLAVSNGSASHLVNTVKGPSAKPQGSGAVKLAPAGAGGTFTVNATAADGTQITGTITCDKFAPAMAEGGN
jgi:hypothetical protein